MNSEKFAAAVAVAIFVGGAIGLGLQRALPEKHTTGPARDMIGAVVGLLTLLCALVSGLLIWTAYGVYAGQTAAIQTLASKVFNSIWRSTTTDPRRTPNVRRCGSVWAKRSIRSGEREKTTPISLRTISLRRSRSCAIRKRRWALSPSTDEQRQALATAKSAIEAIAQARLQMSFALSAPVSYPLLLTVVGWVFFLFFGFGLMSHGGAMPVFALAVGAIAIATAVLLISTFPTLI